MHCQIQNGHKSIHVANEIIRIIALIWNFIARDLQTGHKPFMAGLKITTENDFKINCELQKLLCY